jgi:membrane protease YdiL (CAAX protease family)
LTLNTKSKRPLGQRAGVSFLLSAAVAISGPLTAQENPRPVTPDSSRRPMLGSEFVLPLTGFVVPGLPQFAHRALLAGLGYLGTALTGYALADSSVGRLSEDTLPWHGRDQIADLGFSVLMSASWFSPWDAFHRAVPRLQARGKYTFLPQRENIGSLLSAPFDFRFLRRKTTWVALGETAVITTLILSQREDGVPPFRGQDLGYSAGVSMGAAVGEEAFFRGFLMPVLHQNTGRRFWLANGIQGSIFGGLHYDDEFPAVAAIIAVSSMYTGWVVRRNDWSLREAVFHHFWYDAFVFTAGFLSEKDRMFRITVPPIRF